MNDEEIAAIAKKLDEATQKMNCIVKIMQHGGGPDESHIVATRGGYLKFAALCMRAASSPLKSESKMIDLEDDEVIHEDSDTQFSWFERDETLQTPEEYVAPETPLNDKIALLGCAFFAIFCAIVFIAGLTSIFQELFG